MSSQADEDRVRSWELGARAPDVKGFRRPGSRLQLLTWFFQQPVYPVRVQLDLPFLRSDPQPDLAIHFVRERRARKYIIRIRPDGSLRVTIPRGGSRREAEAFVARHRDWAEKERVRVAAQHAPVEWHAGDSILFHGEPVPLVVERDASESSW